jgi:hypothetical protein
MATEHAVDQLGEMDRSLEVPMHARACVERHACLHRKRIRPEVAAIRVAAAVDAGAGAEVVHESIGDVECSHGTQVRSHGIRARAGRFLESAQG